MQRLFLLAIALIFFISNVNGQGFDDLPLPGPQTDYTQMVDTGNYEIEFPYSGSMRNTTLYGRKNADGSYEGFTYSNITDSITPGAANDRAAFPASGVASSEKYGICHGTGTMHIEMWPGLKQTQAATVYYVYITNATRTVLSMENGDSSAKKFGGVNGTDSDWLLLTIKGYNDTSQVVDSTLFYLADFRSDTVANHYIIKDWVPVGLESMGQVDSLSFSLSSSDVDSNGKMRTPAYFCIDEFSIEGGGGIRTQKLNNQLSLFPNPAQAGGQMTLKDFSGNYEDYFIQAFDISGRKVFGRKITSNQSFRLPELPSGNYVFTILDEEKTIIGYRKINISRK